MSGINVSKIVVLALTALAALLSVSGVQADDFDLYGVGVSACYDDDGDGACGPDDRPARGMIIGVQTLPAGAAMASRTDQSGQAVVMLPQGWYSISCGDRTMRYQVSEVGGGLIEFVISAGYWRVGRAVYIPLLK